MTASTTAARTRVLAGLALGGCTATDPPTPPPATTGASGPAAAPALLQQVAARSVAAGPSC